MSDEVSPADQSRAQMEDLLSKIDDLHSQMRGAVLDYAQAHGVSLDDANAPTSPTPVVSGPENGVGADPAAESSSPIYEGGAVPVVAAPGTPGTHTGAIAAGHTPVPIDAARVPAASADAMGAQSAQVAASQQTGVQAEHVTPGAAHVPAYPEGSPQQVPSQVASPYVQAQADPVYAPHGQVPHVQHVESAQFVQMPHTVQGTSQSVPYGGATVGTPYYPADQGGYVQGYAHIPQGAQGAQAQTPQVPLQQPQAAEYAQLAQSAKVFDPYAIPVPPATPPQFNPAAIASQAGLVQAVPAAQTAPTPQADPTPVALTGQGTPQVSGVDPAADYAVQGLSPHPAAGTAGFIAPSHDLSQANSEGVAYVPLLPRGEGFFSSLVKKTGEGKIGAYLLSGAAALLVFLAAGSLIALLWNQIPDWVKVATVGLVGIALTITGFFMTQRPTKNKAPAATVMGTGGGLVYIALTGAALLKVLALLPAFLFLAAWTIVLIALAVRTRLLFMAVVASIGGIATVILTHVNGFQNPDQAFIGLIMTTGYVAALTATTGTTGRFITSASSRPWYPISALAVALPALFFAPVSASWRTQHVGTAIAIALLFGLILLLCAFIAHQGALTQFYPQLWSAIWVFTPITGTFATSTLTLASIEHTMNPAAIAFSFFIVMMLAGAAGAVKGSPLGNHHWVSGSLFSTVVLMYLIFGSGNVVGPFLPLFTFALACLSAAAAIVARTHYYAWIIPVAVFLTPTFSDGGVAAIVMALVSLLAIGFAVLIEKLVDPHPSFTHLTWVVIAIVLLRLPYFIGSVTADYTASILWGWTAGITTSITMLIVMIVLGLSAAITSPLPLLTGRQWLQRPSLASSHQQFSSTTSAALWLPMSFTILGLIQVFACLLTLAWRAYDLPSFFATPFILALGATLTWMNWPLVRSRFWGLLTGVVITICLTVPVAIISGADSSWPWTIAALLAGAGSILVGFYAKSKALRLYGLALVLLMVLKFALIDIGSQNTGERIVAFLCAGIICFILSVLYNRLNASANNTKATDTSTPVEYAAQPHPEAASEPVTVLFRPDPDAQFRPDAQPQTPYHSTGTPNSPGESPS